jgi:hypothetical protein
LEFLLNTFDEECVHGSVLNGTWPGDITLNYCSGGAGYLIHSKLINKIAQNIEIRNTGYSDVTLGLFLRDNNIKSINYELFNSQPPDFHNVPIINVKNYISFHYIKTMDYMIDFINNKEIMKSILKNNKDNISSLYERLIEKKNSLQGKSNKSEICKIAYEEFKKLVTKFEEICETNISDEIICKNQYTCNICLDECSENRVYKKCTTCHVIFHKDCLIDYFGSCNTTKCCYCQNNSNFTYIYE